MEKEKVLEFLEKNNIEYLKLGTSVYQKNDNILNLSFLYDEKNYDLICEKKKEIENLIKNYVNIDGLNYQIKFKKAFLDEDRLKLFIKEYLKKFHIAYFYALKHCAVEFKENTFFVKLKFVLSSEEVEKINSQIYEFLKTKYFYNFNIESEKVEAKVSTIDEHRQEILDNLLEPTLINKMKVNKLENIIGEISELSCYPFEYYKNPEENVLLCGNLTSIEEVEFTKKDGVTKGLRYALTVKCLEKTFNASLFPTKKNLDMVKTIESGIDVIMQGSLDSFNNGLSLKVKSLAKCKIEDYERAKPTLNREFSTYRFVSPKNYEEISQANLFDEVKNENQYLNENEFVVFDIETTGLDYKTHKITEIGAVKIKNGKIIETFSSFVNPEQNISSEITKLTGITNEMVKDAPLLENVLPDFYKFTKNTILVGQNIQFDLGFIDYYSKQINYVFENKREDTMTIAKKNIFLKNYKLKTIAENLGVSLINAHRAINDAMATAKVFIKLIEKFY